MPKEVINHAIEENSGAEVSIHWSHEVQVGIAIPTEALQNYVRDLDPAKDPVVHWYSPPLTRGEVQKLIKTTRRSRDAVYGADE